jgi:hypothetical protein
VVAELGHEVGEEGDGGLVGDLALPGKSSGVYRM